MFRTSADVVAVEAAVRRDRRPVAGFTAADFELLDNGVPQEITDVSYEKLPIDVTVLLDVSASVTGPALDELRRALRQLRGRPRRRGSPAAHHVQHAHASPRRFHRAGAGIDKALASIGAAGSSSIFDTLAVGLARPVTPGTPAADRALQRWTGQQQHQRRRDAARRREAHDADGRRRSGVARSSVRPRC